jgi:osmotically-inducible protein OsmY
LKPSTVPSDAHLAQLVRGSLGRIARRRGVARINVSSCEGVVTLHGVVPDQEDRRLLEEAARRTPGVRGVVDKLAVK